MVTPMAFEKSSHSRSLIYHFAKIEYTIKVCREYEVKKSCMLRERCHEACSVFSLVVAVHFLFGRA